MEISICTITYIEKSETDFQYVFEPDYKNITLKLLYDKISYDDAIKNGIEIILSTYVFN